MTNDYIKTLSLEEKIKLKESLEKDFQVNADITRKGIP